MQARDEYKKGKLLAFTKTEMLSCERFPRSRSCLDKPELIALDQIAQWLDPSLPRQRFLPPNLAHSTEVAYFSGMKKVLSCGRVLRLLIVAWLVAGTCFGALAQTTDRSNDSGQSFRDMSERYLGPRQRLGVVVEAGTSADFWNVVFEDSGPTNTTTAEVARDPYLLVVGGVSLFNLFGYIDWNVTYRSDNVQGALDLREATIDTGPGRGNTELSSTLQIPLGYIGLGLGYLGAPAEQVNWLNFLRFQLAPTERLFRWETTLAQSPEWVDLDGTTQTSPGNTVLFPARYSEWRYSLLAGLWPLLDDWASDPAASVVAGGSLEGGVMRMSMTSPMQFRVRAADGGFFGPTTTRQFITRNEALGFYTRATLGDTSAAFDMDPNALTVEIWGDFFGGQTTLTTGVFELSTTSASPVSEFNNGRLVARRFGAGGGLARQYAFGRRGNGRFRWGMNAYWHTYNYGPATLGFIDSSFNEWRTPLTQNFGGWEAGDDVQLYFFRSESFWGATIETALRF